MCILSVRIDFIDRQHKHKSTYAERSLSISLVRLIILTNNLSATSTDRSLIIHYLIDTTWTSLLTSPRQLLGLTPPSGDYPTASGIEIQASATTLPVVFTTALSASSTVRESLSLIAVFTIEGVECVEDMDVILTPAPESVSH